MDSTKPTLFQAIIVFGFSGLGAGVASTELASHLILGRYSSSYYQPFFLCGVFLLVALAVSFQVCREAPWPRFSDKPERSMLAAGLILISSFPSITVGVLSGVVVAVLVGGPPPHTWFFYAAPIAGTFICGGLTSALSIAIALFIFTQRWDSKAWTFLALAAVAASIVALAIHADALLTLRYMSEGQTTNGHVLPAMLTFLILYSTLCSACAGFWIYRSQARN